MRIHRWVVTDRQKRFFRSVGIVVLALITIGVLPAMLWVWLIAGIGYGLYKFALRIRRERYDSGTRSI